MSGKPHRSPAPSLLQVFRRHASSRLRVVVMTIFALGIASQSLLGMLGSLHETTSPAHAAHGVAHHMEAHDHEAAVHDGTDEDEGGPLHVLLHYTHCCGHTVWISGVATLAAIITPVRTGPLLQRPGPLPAHGLTAPFRPPIAA